MQDAHLLLKTLTLEYQAEGAKDWRQVPLDAADVKLIGVKTWDAGTADTLRIRMSVRDRAGNVGTVGADPARRPGRQPRRGGCRRGRATRRR